MGPYINPSLLVKAAIVAFAAARDFDDANAEGEGAEVDDRTPENDDCSCYRNTEAEDNKSLSIAGSTSSEVRSSDFRGCRQTRRAPKPLCPQCSPNQNPKP